MVANKAAMIKNPDGNVEASALANVEQSEDLAVQGIQKLNLAGEVKNKVTAVKLRLADMDGLYLPPVPKTDVTLGPYHRTYPLGFVHSIDGNEVIVEGVAKRAPVDEGSILWITRSREPLGFVDFIFEIKTPHYVVRYNTEDEIPSGVGIGTYVSFVPEFANLLNVEYLCESGYEASDEGDKELPKSSKDSIKASHSSQNPLATETSCNRTYQYSERGLYVLSSSGSGSVRPNGIEFRHHRQLTCDLDELMQLPNTIVDADGQGLPDAFFQSTSRMSLGHEQQAISNGTPSKTQQKNLVPNTLSKLLQTPPIVHIPELPVPSRMLPSTSLEMVSQKPEQPIFLQNTFPANGTRNMEQNRLVERPHRTIMPMPSRMPLEQQHIPEPTLIPPYFLFNVGQHVLVGGRTNDRPFPWVFGKNSSNQRREDCSVITVTPTSGVSPPSVPPPMSQYRATQPFFTMPANTDRGGQVHPSVPPKTQSEGWSGEKQVHFGRGSGSSD